MTVIYKFVENHVPREAVLPSIKAAEQRAIRDLHTGHIYPQEIIHVVRDRKAIQALSDHR